MVGILKDKKFSRKFGKHRYYMVPIIYQSVARAHQEAESERKRGHKARVVLRSKGYYVYRTE